MLLKKKGHAGLSYKALSSFIRFLSSKKRLIVYFIVLIVFLVGLLLGHFISAVASPVTDLSTVVRTVIEKTLSFFHTNIGQTRDMVLNARHENIKIPLNYFKGLLSDPQHIDIDIQFDDYQKLAYKRKIALAQGILFASVNDYVPAKISFEDKIYDLRVMLLIIYGGISGPSG